MIEISAEKKANNFKVNIKGHAMYSKGEDILCSAVSILYYSLVAAAEKDAFVTSLETNTEKGLGEISFSGGRESRGAYKMALEGFTMLARQFPENIKIFKAERKR